MTRVLCLFFALAIAAGCGSGKGTPKDGGGDRSGDGVACNGGAGAPKLDGVVCGCNADCASGFCADGVCCTTACNETCKACDVPGSVGACTFVPGGVAPHDGSCTPAAASSCGLDGTCDGAGACRNHPAGTICKSGRCEGSAVVDTNLCDGQGRCRPGPATLCNPFGCDSATGACTTNCRSDGECVAGVKCVNGSCGPKPRGAVCTKDNECASNFCADGLCCNVGCRGPCVSCNQSGRTGTCWPVATGNTDPHKLCRTDTAASCGQTGVCDGIGGCSIYPAQTTVCVPPTCSGDRINTAGTCNGLGSCSQPGLQNCAPYRCAEGACKSRCTTDADCVAGNACISGSCGKKPDGLPCAAGSECLSTFCADGICCDSACAGACRSCKLPATMGTCTPVPAGGDDPHMICTVQDPSTCGTDGKCDGASGCKKHRPGTACAPERCASGVFTPEATCDTTGHCSAPASIACSPFACNGSRCFDACTDDANCEPATFCTNRSCGPKPIGAFCSLPAECGSKFCAQGVCCASACAGACKSCALVGSMGVCTNVSKDAPDPADMCATQMPSTCGTNGKCEAGACQRYAQGVPCRDATCPSNATTLTPEGSCDGSGSCVVPTATSCFPFRCGAAACKSTCSADADCAPPATCGGGSCGLRPTGAVCAGNPECLSNVCEQGICCATTCTASCRSCAVPGSLGTCAPTPAGGTDLANICRDQGPASCGTTGLCDGAGGCELYPAGTQCASPSCPMGTTMATLARVCNGSGTCQPATTQSCGSYLCNGTTCNSACGSDADCSGANVCDNGACGKKRLGQICGVGTECESGNCVDGVCCSAASCGNCRSCNVAGNAGSCQPVPSGDMEPHGACTPAPPCGFTGRCDGLGACLNAPPSTSCGTASCTGSTFTPIGACDGDGACRQVPTSCSPYICGSGACLTTCSGAAQCIAGFTCLGGSCTDLLPDGTACTMGNDCISGNCTEGLCCELSTCGTCQSCAMAGHLGSCFPTVLGMPDPACPDQGAAGCGTNGSCDGAGQCAIYASGTTCAPPSCPNGATMRTVSTCNGTGTCTPAATGCNLYRCDGVTDTCRTSCEIDGECASGAICSGTPGTPGTCSAN